MFSATFEPPGIVMSPASIGPVVLRPLNWARLTGPPPVPYRRKGRISSGIRAQQQVLMPRYVVILLLIGQRTDSPIKQ